jgi:putative signal transducing protein
MKDPTIVRTFADRGEAEIARSLLQAEGIDASVPAEERGGLTPPEEFLSGVQLVVEAADVERARELLDTAVSEATLEAAERESEQS